MIYGDEAWLERAKNRNFCQQIEALSSHHEYETRLCLSCIVKACMIDVKEALKFTRYQCKFILTSPQFQKEALLMDCFTHVTES